MSTPLGLSVVVALISGKRGDVQRCLRALTAQTTQVPFEILVPYDEPCADVITLATEFPSVRFILATGLDTWNARAGASREHHNQLRTIGIAAAGADVIALTEDHAIAADTWCEQLLAALDRIPCAAAVGGPVDCSSDSILNWAVWFCDFGRYQSPLPEGPRDFLSDSNVAYRRTALEAVAAEWHDAYHETMVHDAMRRTGLELHGAPAAIVWQARSGLSMTTALRERYIWGRSFGASRARKMTWPSRAIFAALSPVLPVVMTARLVQLTGHRSRHTRQFAKALPLIFGLHIVWAFGECVGYLDRGATPLHRT